MDNEKYRVVIKETSYSKNKIFEDLDYSGVLKHYEEFKTALQLKIYRSTDNKFWEVESIFENGELIQFKDIKKKATQKDKEIPYVMDSSLGDFYDLFTKIDNAAPSRKENPITLIQAFLNKEDITKPKLTVINTNETMNNSK
ncbi:hypothetical protein [Viridibacillus arvi]|uniref:hypothetical protein n=1 Tax=Viridibacillus arvi TaxID=263475 RepID=UPI0034CD626E